MDTRSIYKSPHTEVVEIHGSGILMASGETRDTGVTVTFGTSINSGWSTPWKIGIIYN